MQYTGGMTQTQNQRMNAKRPVVPFRCPSSDEHRLLLTYAAQDEVTVSEWVRGAVAEKMKRYRNRRD